MHLDNCVIKTALSESELEYNSEHTSTSAFVRFKLTQVGDRLASVTGGMNVYAVVWTTTPWTLPANQAIAVDANSSYLAVTDNKDVYLIGRQFASPFKSILAPSSGQLKELLQIEGHELVASCKYAAALFPPNFNASSTCLPFLPSDCVEKDKGTGLIHCAPSYGKEDFELCRKFDIRPINIVDNCARYTDQAPAGLVGLNVVNEGTKEVLKLLSDHVLHHEPFVHSYPYDWRTKTPVIVRLSDQWFIDTSQLAERALSAYEKVFVYPPAQKSSMLPFISNRPRWCISRQRSWGVPIPVLFNSIANGRPIIDLEFIQSIAERALVKGCDFWFAQSIENIVPDRFWSKWSLTPRDVVKSNDVFDVWFDSGLSWLAVQDFDGFPKDPLYDLNFLAMQSISKRIVFIAVRKLFSSSKHIPSDVCVEGRDQFRGWFSASLLLGVALSGQSPYKSLVVHGFTTDSEGRKMSKSLGNVISPGEALASYCTHNLDVFRRWALCSSLDSLCSIGRQEMSQQADYYRIVRNSFRFILGNLHDFDPVVYLAHVTQSSPLPNTIHHSLLFQTLPRNLTHSSLDCAVLSWLGSLTSRCLDLHFPQLQLAQLLAEVDQLISRLSSVYFNSVKDILYCDHVDSSHRRNVQAVLWLYNETLKAVLSPLLPYLVEELEAIGSNASSIHATALERLASLELSASASPQSVWSNCLASARTWEHDFTQQSRSLDALLSLYRSIVDHVASQSANERFGTPANPLGKSRLTIIVDVGDHSPTESIRSDLQQFQSPGDNFQSHSDLCHMFRAASIRWISSRSDKHDLSSASLSESSFSFTLDGPFKGTQVLVDPLSHADQFCPRCRRYTRETTEELCNRCLTASIHTSTGAKEDRVHRV